MKNEVCLCLTLIYHWEQQHEFMCFSDRYAMRLKNFSSHSASVTEKKLAVLWYEFDFFGVFLSNINCIKCEG